MALCSYVRKKELGAGAFGKAYLYEKKDTRDNVVIKEVNLLKLPSSKDRENARKETELLSQMNHRNIVKYFESFEEKNNLYIVMEYCNAGDLHQKIMTQGKVLFSEEKILDWVVQMCLGIKHIHDRKILHRDIKSQNIFLTTNDLVKIGDFGVAKALSSTMALARTCIGTPFYLSPEICKQTAYNNKCDIWSLGCVVYEVAALDFPFKANDFHALKNRITRHEYAPLPTRYSYDFRHFISLLLKKDPTQRPNINAVLRKPLLKDRIEKFMTEEEIMNEFNHTVLHGRNAPNRVVPLKNSNNKRPGSARSVNTPVKAARPVAKPSDNKRIQPVNVRLNEAARRRMEMQKNIELDRKKLEIEEKKRQLQERQILNEINQARESGWQSVLSSGDSSSGNQHVPKPFSPYLAPVTPASRPNSANNRLASPRVAPSPSTPDKYKAYHDELDRQNEERKLRAENFNLQNNKDKYMEAPVVNPAPSPLPNVAAAQQSAYKAKQAAEQSVLVQEYLERKAIAARIKSQAQGRGVLGVAPEATPVSQQEKDCRDRLEKIRLQNFYNRRNIMNVPADGNDRVFPSPRGDTPREPNSAADNEVEERKRKIQDLKRQAEERSRILKEQLEQKRQQAYENEKKKFDMKLQEKNNQVENNPAIRKEKPSAELVSGPGISFCMNQLNSEPPQPVMTEKPVNASVEDSEVKKMKEDILKRVNIKYNEGKQKWGLPSPDQKSSDQAPNAFDFLKNKELEFTGTKMESTFVLRSPKDDNEMNKKDLDTSQSESKRPWSDPRNSFIHRLANLPVEGELSHKTQQTELDNQSTLYDKEEEDLPSPEVLGKTTINIQAPLLPPAGVIPAPELIEGEPTAHVVAAPPDLSRIMEVSQENIISISNMEESNVEDPLAATMEGTESIANDAVLSNNTPILANLSVRKDPEFVAPKLMNKPCDTPKVAQNRPIEISLQGEGKFFNKIDATAKDSVVKDEKNVDVLVDDIEEDEAEMETNKSTDEKRKEFSKTVQDEKVPQNDKMSSLKEHLTTGKFDPGNTSMLRTCSLPDLTLLNVQKPSPPKPAVRLRTNSSSVCSVHDNEEDYSVVGKTRNDSGSDCSGEEEDEEIDEVRMSMQQILDLNSSSEDLSDTVQQLQNVFENEEEQEQEEIEENDSENVEEETEYDSDIGDADEDFSDPCMNNDDRFVFIETERLELEKELGMDLLMQAYDYIQNEMDDDPSNISDNDCSEVAVKEMLGPDKAHLYERICSLILLSNSYE